MSDRAHDFHALPRLREFSLGDLDGEIPIFPLAGALLLPRGRMPLNIFEPRYLAMVDDALRGRRLIGMVQPHRTGSEDDEDEESDTDLDPDSEDDDDQDGDVAARSSRRQTRQADAAKGRIVGPAPSPVSRRATSSTTSPGAGPARPQTPLLVERLQAPPIYQIGCVGRLISFVEREDGTCAITLAGIARFRVRRELDTVHGYRRVHADFAPFADDLADSGALVFDRDRLIDALRRYFSHRGFEARWDAIDQMDDETLIITLSMICPFPAAEKQALLEAHTVAERAGTLLALLQMAGHEPNDGGRKTHAV